MNRIKYAGLVVFTTFLMGVAFPVGKIGLAYGTPLLIMGIRFVLAGALLAMFTAKRPQPRGWRQWGKIAAIGALQTAGVMGCAYTGMRWITSGESAILIFVNPLLVIVLGTLFAGARYRMRQWLGVAVGSFGLALAFGLRLHLQPGTWIALAGGFSFAAATLLVKRWGPAFDTAVLTAYQMLAGGLLLLLFSAAAERPRIEWNLTVAAVIVWLAIMCSIVQFAAWFYLLQHSDPARTSAFLFLAPLFGVAAGWLMLGEQPTWHVWAGGGLIGIGIMLVNGRFRTGRPVPRDLPTARAESFGGTEE